MQFSESDRVVLLAAKGVGDKIIQRLEEIGFYSLTDFGTANVDDVVASNSKWDRLFDETSVERYSTTTQISKL